VQIKARRSKNLCSCLLPSMSRGFSVFITILVDEVEQNFVKILFDLPADE